MLCYVRELPNQDNPAGRQSNERPARGAKPVFIPTLQIDPKSGCEVIERDR
jgi:hypothetical protein